MRLPTELLAAGFWIGGLGIAPAQAPGELELMPRVEDRTSMWWRDGFPGVVEGARWHRCLRTGQFGMILDTEKLAIPHFGPASFKTDLEALPPAGLSLRITVDGKTYRCAAGGKWSRHGGPRLIESGRFFQRADVTDLRFEGEDGTPLNVEARFETAAWPDRLALILAARPGELAIPAGDAAFGRVRGGFGLDGTNHLEISPEAAPDSESFTLDLWAFVPPDYLATRATPWLVCKNRNELADGNYGIVIGSRGIPQARLNIGGGRENAHVVISNRPLKLGGWNHLAISYDGEKFLLYLNGQIEGEKTIGRKRVPVAGALAIGRRQDDSGDGYHFRGVVDEIRLYDRALTLEELRSHYHKPEIERPELKPVAEWPFREEGRALMTRPRESWNSAALEIALSFGGRELQARSEFPEGETRAESGWLETSLAFDPAGFEKAEAENSIAVTASEIGDGTGRPVEYDASLGWHRINLDGIEPIAPPGVENPSNDALERVRLILSNPTGREEIARLMFEKTARGIRQRIGTPITGISAILRSPEGNPTGIPVQLSKNWHNDPRGGVYSGQWFHGISQVRLPPRSTVELELTLAYGHWGGVPAASHSQLSLIGWGGNTRWDQSALGAWGESICFDPDQVQADCTITDVRPLMVRPMGREEPWGWTSNVGGGDCFRLFNPAGDRIPHTSVETEYRRQGPCLTEVTYAGRIGNGIVHETTVSLARSDDLVRGIYRIRMDVKKAADFSRFVIFQIGADTYSATGERKMAIGDETGLLKEWDTQWGGDTYRTEPVECAGRIPWASLHDAVPRVREKPGAWANRGIVIREWKARFGGKEARPWMAERGLDLRSETSSILDILPPPDVTRLEPGDFVEATIEHIVMPQFAKDYYGPNEALRSALKENENTWRMISREAIGNDRHVEMISGTLQWRHPDIRIHADEGESRFRLSGGHGYVPITFAGLSSSKGFQLRIDGTPVDQSIHGNDFWQTDFDPATKTWSQTFNISFPENQKHAIHFSPKP